ncbi:hypothetical protein glysoja_022877 [Glycine soja]|nr:hypothetical protein glysoja_022877 [Glycine soja]
MANNFYNNAQFSKLYNSPDPKGCKLCNQVFTNTQALLTTWAIAQGSRALKPPMLLTHVESHMAQEKDVVRRLNSSPPQHVNSQIQLGSHQFPPPPTMDDIGIFQSQSQLMGMSQPISRNPFFNSNQIGSSSSSSSMPIRKMQVLPHAFPYVGNINGDGFKAFISNLEKPIKKIDFIDLVNVDDDNNSDVEVMDLDLKL